MELNNFERQIKEKLEQREIRPAEQAWEKISSRLEAREAPKRRPFFKYGVAAALLGLLVLSALWYRSGENTVITEELPVVDLPNDNLPSPSEDKPTKLENMNEPLVITDEIAEVPEDKEISPERSLNPMTEVSAVTAVEQPKLVPPAVNDQEEELYETKIAEVVAQVGILEQRSEAVTEAEIDSLLRQAQTEILTDKLFNHQGQVDALALLSEVEQELDQTFRDQIFEKLKSGFLKVRTAVAARND